MNYYQKALLYAYPKIDKIISHIDNVVMKKALASFSNHTSCLLQSEAIIEYSNKKQKMLYLNRKLEEIFASMKKEDMLLIEYKYFKKRNEETEKLVTATELQNNSFEQIIKNRVSKYIGKTQDELKVLFGIESNAKNINELLICRMFGIKSDLSKTDEFKKANIVAKTVRIQYSGTIKESLPFPAFKYKK